VRAKLPMAMACAILVLATLLSTSTASAAVRRYALVVGNNRGDAGDLDLRYAETDAQRVYDVLKDLGRFEPADMVLLRGEEATRAEATLIALNDRVRATIAAGSDALLFVYYSGHAGADALHMAGTHLDLTLLEQLVRGSAATFRVLAVDACRSGALTRVKGGQSAPPFALRIDEHLSEQGLVMLTSSAANEDAQESDALQGSIFTHYFVSALLGAGDSDGDGRVTLEEAYRYAYEATLRSTSATWAGAQHPTFRYELRGMGKLPLSELAAVTGSRAWLVFPAGKTYLVLRGGEGGAVVGEVTEYAGGRGLSVRAGHYFVRGRTADALLEGELDAAPGASVEVDDRRLRRVEYARLVRKGGGAKRSAAGPEAGYFFQTALENAATLCQGGVRRLRRPSRERERRRAARRLPRRLLQRRSAGVVEPARRRASRGPRLGPADRQRRPRARGRWMAPAADLHDARHRAPPLDGCRIGRPRARPSRRRRRRLLPVRRDVSRLLPVPPGEGSARLGVVRPVLRAPAGVRSGQGVVSRWPFPVSSDGRACSSAWIARTTWPRDTG
jgi:hypothetical protein